MLNQAIVKIVPFLPPKLVARVAGRYIAGDSAAEGLALAETLKRSGFSTTIDILGEDTETRIQASDAAEDYIHLMKGMAAKAVSRHVSLKLTQLGLRLSEKLAFENLEKVLAAAEKSGTFVCIDMESAAYTTATLKIHGRAQGSWESVGTVLQARLRRTLRDADRLKGAAIRLCKGAYREAPEISYHRKRAVRRSFLESFRRLVRNDCYVAVATHDVQLIHRIRREVLRQGIPRDRLEFQSLLGVPIRSTLIALRDEGFKVRLYVPFGSASLAYSLRRLEENPELAIAIAKSFFKRDRLDAGHLL